MSLNVKTQHREQSGPFALSAFLRVCIAFHFLLIFSAHGATGVPATDSSELESQGLAVTGEQDSLEIMEENDFLGSESSTLSPSLPSPSKVVPGSASTSLASPSDSSSSLERKYVPPTPTPGGGVYRRFHPDASKGLLRIEADGTYQYKVEKIDKSRSASFRYAQLQPPIVRTGDGVASYSRMYGSRDLDVLSFDYEWFPWKGWGAFGVQAGVGFTTISGRGVLRDGQNTTAQEKFTLFVAPITVGAKYRLEFWSHQYLVPFAQAGFTYFGIAETRDDGKANRYAGAPAGFVGGGGLINITRWSPRSAFNLSKEYGISDLWVTIEYRGYQGLRSDIDFSSNMLSGGISVDY